MQLKQKMENLIEEMLNGHILLSEAMFEFEKIYIQKAIERYRYINKAAHALGVHRNTLSKKIASYRNAQKSEASTKG
jgi:transcriptional regulator with PAS, ATPase and Fis domain